MKQKLKKILLLCLLTGTLFVSCTMEEEVIRNHNYSKDIKIYQKSFDELIKDSKFATSFNKLPKRKTSLKSSKQARTAMEEQYGFTITNTPVRVMQVGNLTSYTFHIERNTPNETYFENLVVQNDSIGNTNAHIIKYTPFMPMTSYIEHNSYSFVGDTEVTSIVYDDNNINGKMVTECRDLYGFRCTGSYSTSNGSSCTASPHIPMGYCTDLTPECIKYTFITESCTSYDDGITDISTGGGTSSGSSQSGGSGTGGTDPIYSDPLCPTCPEFSDKDCNTSKEDIMLAFPNISNTNAEILANTINQYGGQFGIDSNYKLQHFLSQAGHETGGFNSLTMSENLNYTTSARLLAVFPKYFSLTDPLKENPDEYIGNPEKIGNLIYGNRMGNGDIASGEGYKFRGRGLIQLTGKNNYLAFQNYYNREFDPDINLLSNPEELNSNSELAIISALWFFQINVINKDDLNDTVKNVTKKVNGGYNGLTDRVNKFNSCENLIDCLTE